MLELSFRSRTSCWSCFVCFFSESSWLWFVYEVDLDGDFPLLFMFKLLSYSTVVASLASVLHLLVFLFKLVLLFLRLKMSEQRRFLGFFFYSIFSLSQRLSGSSQFVFQSIELFEFLLFQYFSSSYFVVFNFTLNRFKLLLVCVAFQWSLCSAYFSCGCVDCFVAKLNDVFH